MQSALLLSDTRRNISVTFDRTSDERRPGITRGITRGHSDWKQLLSAAVPAADFDKLRHQLSSSLTDGICVPLT